MDPAFDIVEIDDHLCHNRRYRSYHERPCSAPGLADHSSTMAGMIGQSQPPDRMASATNDMAPDTLAGLIGARSWGPPCSQSGSLFEHFVMSMS